MPRLRLAPWLRRGLEAAVVAALVAIASLAGNRLAAGGTAYPVPSGAVGALVLAPAVLALGVLTCAYPMAMAPTRADAVFGALVAFLVAADLTIVFGAGPMLLPNGAQLSGGAVVALLGAAPAIVGLAAGQVLTPLGFGRRAGAVGAVLAATVAVGVLAVAAMPR
ncbi:MAG TPA: hypothetical protein VGC90_10220 [Candidatus Limnocylindrales bacterium]